MKTPTFKTKCTVRLQKSKADEHEYYLFVEAYPVYEDGNVKPKRKSTFLNRSIRTIIWDKKRTTRGGNNQPRRNVEGVIQCRSKNDQQSALFAAQVCAAMQDEYNKKALFPEQYKEQQEQYAREQIKVLPYIHEAINKRQEKLTGGTMRVWGGFLKKYQEFEGKVKLTFGDIDRAKIEEFINFIANYKSKKVAKLAANSQKTMIRCFQAVLNDAYKEGIITFNPNHAIKMPKGEQKQKEYLTLSELQTLSNTECPNENVKRISLFSALTGMRHSDCAKLKWENITGGENPSIKFSQKKTKGAVYMPISAEALELCGERTDEQDLIFKGVQHSNVCNKIIAEWVKKAGITKSITFHCFRHTFATLQLTHGTDIYTVSKMLGHADVKTTQIYAQIVDEKKEKAANVIKLKDKK
ncbi:site-specific integrase [Bacteroidales bacterium OttesenSCG-928-B11]|nr:site-specific integrase [Bacteroidales bacterium OttesenSCG-928-B11]